MSQQNVNVKGAAEGPRNHYEGPEPKDLTQPPSVQASIVGNCDQVAAYLKECYPNEVFSVIVWTREEIKNLAMENDLDITDEQADEALHDIAAQEWHGHGQNNESAFSYIISANGLDKDD